MAMTRKKVAALTTGAGGAVVSVGVALIYLPAGVIVTGLALAAAGLFLIDVDKRS